MAKQVEILFKGMTRPAMLFGVPILPLISVLALISLVSVWTNIMYILVAIPIVLIMRFIVTFDDFMYSILFQSFKLKTPSLNKKYYGVKTFSSMEYRKMSNRIDYPILSILGLSSNPSFEKYIPYSSLLDDSLVLTKEYQLMSSWEIKGIAFEVESEENQDSINKMLANIFSAFSSEPVSFYFHSARHDVDTHLKANYENKYLQEINDLYFKFC